MDISLVSTVLFHLREIQEKSLGKYSKVLIGERLIKISPGFSMLCTSSIENPNIPKSFYQSFRPLKLIQPSFLVVAEYKLASFGVPKAKEYAQKIVTAMKLVETNFYSVEKSVASDTVFAFTMGIPVLNSLIARIIEFGDKDPRKNMDLVIAESFYKRYSKEIKDRHKDILVEILETVFRCDLGHQKQQKSSLKNRILFTDAMRDLNLEPTENLLNKCQTLWNIIKTSRRKWVVISGPACTAKSSILTIIAWAWALKKSRGFHIHKLSKKFTVKAIDFLIESIANPQNYHTHSQFSTYKVSKFQLKSSYTNFDWIVIDTRDMNFDFSVLNSLTKPMFFVSDGRSIAMSPESKLIIEVENLEKLNPSDLADFTVFCTSIEDLEPKILYHSLVAKIENSNKDFFEKHYVKVWLPCYDFINSCENFHFRLDYRIWLIQFCKLLQVLMKDLTLDQVNISNSYSQKFTSQTTFKFHNSAAEHEKAKPKPNKYNPEEVDKTGELISFMLKYISGLKTSENLQITPITIWESLYMNAIIYTIGSCLKSDDKDKFSQFIFQLLEEASDNYASGLKSKMLEGTGRSIFDLYFSHVNNQWMS